MKSCFRALALLFLTILVGACASRPAAPPAPPPTVAALSISIAKDINPSDEGKVLVVRVFRLADPAAFQKAKFDDLFEKDEKTLGTDLVGTIDLLIEPGAVEQFDRTLTDRDRYLGFVVPYRNLDKSQWRALVPVRPRGTTKVDVEVGADGVIASTLDS